MGQMLTSAPDLIVDGNARQTYEFVHGDADYHGHLMAFSVGDETLDADIPLVDPTNPDGQSPIKACAILTMNNWRERKVGQPLFFQARVSTANRAKLFRSAIQEKQGTNCTFNFIWYMYWEPDNIYFKHFHCNDEDIEGEVVAESPIFVANTPAVDINQFKNYDFTIGIKGVDTKDQNLHLAATPSDKDVLAFSRIRAA